MPFANFSVDRNPLSAEGTHIRIPRIKCNLGQRIQGRRIIDLLCRHSTTVAKPCCTDHLSPGAARSADHFSYRSPSRQNVFDNQDSALVEQVVIASTKREAADLVLLRI